MFSIEVIRGSNVNERWDVVGPLVDKCVKKAVHGEYTSADIRELLEHERMTALLVSEDGQPIFVCVFEFLFYPRKTVVNICAVGGRKILECLNYYRKYLLEYWNSAGATEVQAEVSPAMERLLRPAGFREVYRTVRMEI